MKKKKLYIILLIVSLVLNIILGSLFIYQSNSASKYSKIWDMATNNANFLYQQYDERNIVEAYDYAIGEIGTMGNVITFLDYGDEDDIIEFATFYYNLVKEPEAMKQHISDVREIINLTQDEDVDAFLKMKDLRESIE